MTNILNNWTYQQIRNFLQENGFNFFEKLKGSRQVWVKLAPNGEPARFVEISFRHDGYPDKALKNLIRQSGIDEKRWIDWVGK